MRRIYHPAPSRQDQRPKQEVEPPRRTPPGETETRRKPTRLTDWASI